MKNLCSSKNKFQPKMPINFLQKKNALKDAVQNIIIKTTSFSPIEPNSFFAEIAILKTE